MSRDTLERYNELMNLHGKHKADVIEGKKYHANIIIATVGIFPTKHLAMYRPPDFNCWVLGVNTLLEDYNDPMPAIREINGLIAKLEQLKMTFTRAWENEMKQPTQDLDCRMSQMYHIEDKPKNNLREAVEMKYEESQVSAVELAKEMNNIGDAPKQTESQYCIQIDHKKDCRCHLGYRIKLK